MVIAEMVVHDVTDNMRAVPALGEPQPSWGLGQVVELQVFNDRGIVRVAAQHQLCSPLAARGRDAPHRAAAANWRGAVGSEALHGRSGFKKIMSTQDTNCRWNARSKTVVLHGFTERWPAPK